MIIFSRKIIGLHIKTTDTKGEKNLKHLFMIGITVSVKHVGSIQITTNAAGNEESLEFSMVGK